MEQLLHGALKEPNQEDRKANTEVEIKALKFAYDVGFQVQSRLMLARAFVTVLQQPSCDCIVRGVCNRISFDVGGTYHLIVWPFCPILPGICQESCFGHFFVAVISRLICFEQQTGCK